MKSTNILAIAIIAAASFTNQVVAQETTDIQKSKTKSNNANERSAGYDLKKATKFTVVPTSTGCDIVCDLGVQSPRDAASGLATGKRSHSVAYENPDVSTVENVRATGQHIKEAKLTARSSGGGAGKVSMQDFHFTIKSKGRAIPITIENDTCILPVDCPDGTYDLVCSWSWGVSNAGSQSNKAVSYLIKIENGVCTDMAINEKGVPKGEKK